MLMSQQQRQLSNSTKIYVICRLGGPYGEKLPEAAGRGQHFQDLGHSFHHTDRSLAGK